MLNFYFHEFNSISALKNIIISNCLSIQNFSFPQVSRFLYLKKRKKTTVQQKNKNSNNIERIKIGQNYKNITHMNIQQHQDIFTKFKHVLPIVSLLVRNIILVVVRLMHVTHGYIQQKELPKKKNRIQYSIEFSMLKK